MSRLPPRLAFLLLAAALSLAGCGSMTLPSLSSLPVPEPAYTDSVQTYEQDFSDAGNAAADARAARACTARKLLPILTQRVCTLESCRSSYQCISAADKQQYGL